MPPLVIDLNKTEDPNDAVHLAVEFIAAGKLVALPTETEYHVAASGLNIEAARKIRKLKVIENQQPFFLAVKSSQDALDYVPDLSPVGQRLTRRCWPGPVTVILNGTHQESLLTQMPSDVRDLVMPNQSVGLRVPDHQVFRSISSLTIGPLVLTSANLPGESECTTGAAVAERLGDQVDLVLDDGNTRYQKPATVVELNGNCIKVLQPGVLGESALKRMSSFLALMVCTGNTCRSPMAEVLFKKQLAEKLGCTVDQLEENGVIVSSAGVAAMPGAKASQESIDVVKKLGLNLQDHQSQPVSDELLKSADLILTMTNNHRQALVMHWPEIADRTHVISVNGSDISDPIGGPLELYENCAKQIDEHLKSWVERIELGLKE